MGEKLAIMGGGRAVPEGFEKPWPIITQDDIDAVTEVLKRGELWGPEATEKTALEKEWAAYCGVRHCIVTNSGTSAMHACVAGAGVETGDEVIIPAFTFWATAQAVLCQNAIPIFVDIDPVTYNIDPSKIEEKITERTKAIIVVHVHGLPCEMDEINAIAKKHGLKVLEDAAHAHGSIYKGKKAGNLGDMAMFSLNGTKNLPGGEGGFVTTNDPDFYEKARLTCMFGEKRIPKGNIRPYDAHTMGNNYRPVEMTCAFVRSQLKRLDRYNEMRIENVNCLSQELGKIKGIVPPRVPSDRTSVFHIYRIKLDPEAAGYGSVDPEDFRWAVQNALFAEGVPVMEWHSFPVPGQKIFHNLDAYGKGCPWNCGHARKGIRYDSNDYPETQKMFAASFVLYTIYASNGLDLMKYYVDAFHKVFGHLDELVTQSKYYERVRASL
jgi:dTDP-4-amino-4,6-dideoxygalactose transaminase